MAYDDVPTEEAVDLIMTLPRGSRWRAAHMEFGEWDDARESAADVVDAVQRLIRLACTGSTDGALVVARPRVLRARKAASDRARAARELIESTRWEEVV